MTGRALGVAITLAPLASALLLGLHHAGRALAHRIRKGPPMTAPASLVLEVRNQPDATPTAGPLMLPPPINEDYWSYRVRVADGQAIVGFPKFLTMGIGFAVEEDENTNLPYTCDAEEIYEHIKHNRGDASITREVCVAAIRLIQDAVRDGHAPLDPRIRP